MSELVYKNGEIESVQTDIFDVEGATKELTGAKTMKTKYIKELRQLKAAATKIMVRSSQTPVGEVLKNILMDYEIKKQNIYQKVWEEANQSENEKEQSSELTANNETESNNFKREDLIDQIDEEDLLISDDLEEILSAEDLADVVEIEDLVDNVEDIFEEDILEELIGKTESKKYLGSLENRKLSQSNTIVNKLISLKNRPIKLAGFWEQYKTILQKIFKQIKPNVKAIVKKIGGIKELPYSISYHRKKFDAKSNSAELISESSLLEDEELPGNQEKQSKLRKNLQLGKGNIEFAEVEEVLEDTKAKENIENRYRKTKENIIPTIRNNMIKCVLLIDPTAVVNPDRIKETKGIEIER